MRFALPLLLLAGLLTPAWADIIPEGHQSVTHVLVLDDCALPDDVRFFLAPTRGFGGVHAWLPGMGARFSGKYGTRVYALRAGVEAPETPKELAAAAFASGKIPVAHESNAPNLDPTHRIVSLVRLTGIEGDTIMFEEVDTRRYTLVEDGSQVEAYVFPNFPVLGGVALVGIVLGVLIGRRRRVPAA